MGGLAAPPSVVRHTAASIWPQCTLYNKEGLPLFPFEMRVSLIDEQQQVSAKSDDETEAVSSRQELLESSTR